jgi:hypothetical protein
MKERVSLKLNSINTHDSVVYVLIIAVCGIVVAQDSMTRTPWCLFVLLLNLIYVFIGIIRFSWVSCTKPNQQFVTPPTERWVGLGFRRDWIFLFLRGFLGLRRSGAILALISLSTISRGFTLFGILKPSRSNWLLPAPQAL